MTTGARRKSSFFVVLLLVALLACCQPRQPQLTSYEVDEDISAGVTYINVPSDIERRTRTAMSSLFTERCTKAFVDEGLTSPVEVVRVSGIVIRPANDLYKYPARELGLVNDQILTTYAKEFSTCRAQAGTIRPTRNGVRLTTDQRYRLFLHGKAFIGESLFLGTYSLRDVLTHEFIHMGGQSPMPGRSPGHDLNGFEPHDRILKACR